MWLDNKTGRLVSLDFMRGLIMVLLMLESTYLYSHLNDLFPTGILHGFFIQFEHHAWHGLRFWDMIQPGFMYIAGVAMAFSLHRQIEQGKSWGARLSKTLKRSGWLFFWGVLDYAVRGDHLSFELWDVLTQLSFTTLVTFLVFEWKYGYQALACLGLLALTEILYRFTNIPGFDQPFTDQHNFGNYVDLLLMNKINAGGWVAINAIPTSVHTIAGAMVGKWMIGARTDRDRVSWIIYAGLTCLVIGYLQDLAGITPIIKRIATTSFTLVTAGYCLLATALFYWWIDMKEHHKGLWFFIIVGMNSIFIYLFFEIVGHRWFNEYIYTFTDNLLFFLPHGLMKILGALVIFGLEWGMLLFLYRKKIFFKL
ncbi:MAG TPA: DUF5009 domain-containing protein [Saprospiraceae bacterium]|nr:DUF5009 domain-containing protein [Saprospiraceae bacterium]MCB9270270.1 DUF5009 domain-containing protein [Lewinellaceae bacterium]HPG09529.1 DUF5009 domain-containing protein [Saprospiraceae bacterium]HPQ98375.1 DUF5009 domain-containing protein [Saprospiraceae bacterium]HQU52837.1 DUF5009 domain-containing protein [Saprospiraceae bacterium]